MENGVSWPGWITGNRMGKGGFGSVYEIYRNEYDVHEKAALKVLSIPQSEDEIDLLRCGGMDDESITTQYNNHVKDIVHEYKMMIDLKNCPNVVRCEDYMVVKFEKGLGWNIYLKMELLTPLLKAMDQVNSEKKIIKLGIDLCNALVICQKKSIIHRDIKPQNIFVDENGNFKLGDFGIARTAEKTTKATVRVGTYNYMAPEVYNDQPYGATADIYSLGMVLYWLLNKGRGPFLPLPPENYTVSMDEDARHRRFRGEELPVPANGSLSLQHIVLKACAFNPKDRYQSAQEMMDSLKKFEKNCADMEPASVVPEGEVSATKAGMDDQSTVLDKGNGDRPKEKDIRSGPGIKRRKCIIAVACAIMMLSVAFILGSRIGSSKDDPMRIIHNEESKLITETEEKIYSEDVQPAKSENGILIKSVKAGRDHTVALYSDGTVRAIGSNAYGQCNTSEWIDIEQISTMRLHTVGLKSDGTVVSVGLNKDGQCNVANWENIIDISAGDHHTVGLKSDGTVVATGYNQYGECDVAGWSDIIAVETAFNNTLGLKSDGTVLITGAFAHGRLSNWSDIVSISAGDSHFIGLQSDGTVVAAGTNNHGQCNLSGWNDIVSVCAGAAYTVGLRSDGTILVEGINDRGQHEAQYWNNIEQIVSGIEHIVGIRSDGTLVAVGANDNSQCDVDQLENVIVENPASGKTSVEVGDMISFGHYEQDGNQKNGPENIEWLVLDVQGNSALLLSQYALDAQPYHVDYEAVTWETSTIRNWLNSTFLNTAFTTEEQDAILLTTVDNSALQGNKRWSDQEQNDTKDNVFLLSYAETDLYFEDDESRRCIPTNYAISMGAETRNFTYGTPDTGWWWLRSPGEKQYHAAFVSFDGERHSNAVGNGYLSMRPALWVDMDSDALVKLGELSEDNTNSMVDAIRERLPIVTYAMTDSDKVYSYSDASLSRQTDWYYFDSRKDEIVIIDVSDDGNALYVRYPSTTSGTGYRDCWFESEDVFNLSDETIGVYRSENKTTTFRLENANSLVSYGSINAGDTCIKLGSHVTGSNLLICPIAETKVLGIQVTEKMVLLPSP